MARLVDDVVVVDDHITGGVSEDQARKVLGWPDACMRIKARRSTPGRYFQVTNPGLGWGGADWTIRSTSSTHGWRRKACGRG